MIELCRHKLRRHDKNLLNQSYRLHTSPAIENAGFAATDKYEDLVKAGVIDPTKVTRTALQNAASVATLLLTSDALIAEAPKKDKKGGAPGHGGMDDMY